MLSKLLLPIKSQLSEFIYNYKYSRLLVQYLYFFILKKEVVRQKEKIFRKKISTEILANKQIELMWESFQLKKKNFGEPNKCAQPIKKIPEKLMNRFTMNGIATIEDNVHHQ